jgi:cation diffusion facilitator family transporter
VNKKQTGLLVIFGGIFVFLLKLLAFFTSNSVALFSDAMESIINIVASIMMFTALIIAAKPEDGSHEYGHQKAENISALVEGVLIILAAVLIIEAALSRLFSPAAFEDINLGIVISLGATSLNALLAILMLRASRRSQSMALEGDARHLTSDVISSVGVVIGLFIATVTGLYILDPLIALVVAALLIVMGIRVFRKTSRDLMDSNCEEEEKKIIAILDKSQGYTEYHELKTRRSGSRVFMDVHLCVDGDMPVSKAHDLTERIEKELELGVPGIVPTIHVEDQAHCQKHKAK